MYVRGRPRRRLGVLASRVSSFPRFTTHRYGCSPDGAGDADAMARCARRRRRGAGRGWPATPAAGGVVDRQMGRPRNAVRPASAAVRAAQRRNCVAAEARMHWWGRRVRVVPSSALGAGDQKKKLSETSSAVAHFSQLSILAPPPLPSSSLLSPFQDGQDPPALRLQAGCVLEWWRTLIVCAGTRALAAGVWGRRGRARTAAAASVHFSGRAEFRGHAHRRGRPGARATPTPSPGRLNRCMHSWGWADPPRGTRIPRPPGPEGGFPCGRRPPPPPIPPARAVFSV